MPMSSTDPVAFPCLACGYPTELSLTTCPECGATLDEQRAVVTATRDLLARHAERFRKVTLISVGSASLLIATLGLVYQASPPFLLVAIVAGAILIGGVELFAVIIGRYSAEAEREITIAAWRLHSLWLVAPFLASSLAIPLTRIIMFDHRMTMAVGNSGIGQAVTSLSGPLVVLAVIGMFRWAALEHDTMTGAGVRTRRGSYVMIALGASLLAISLLLGLLGVAAAALLCDDLRSRGVI